MSDTTANPQDFVTKRKQPLLGTFSISVLIHAAVVALLGGVVVFKVLERPPAQFKPPPPPAKVTKQGDAYQIMGAAWGDPIAGVEVQIDEEPWQPATLTEGAGEAFGWTFWTLDWGTPSPGEHTITSRAIAENGEVQPAPDDPLLTGKTTYWESNGQITRRVQIS